MKLFFSCFTTLALCSLTLAQGPSFPGNGTKNNPYLISTKNHLLEINDSIKLYDYWTHNKYFSLTSNIYSSTVPIGNSTGDGLDQPKAFAGYFQGNNNTIGLNISYLSSFNGEGLGCFGAVSNGLIENLKVSGSCTGYNGPNRVAKVGSIAGALYGESKMINCTSSANVYVYEKYGGGLVGWVLGESKERGGVISSCSFDGTIQQNGSLLSNVYALGGLVGSIEFGKITQSESKGKMTSSSFEACGGIVGRSVNATVEDCKRLGNITTTSSLGQTGGIIGNSKESKITNCRNSAIIKAGSSDIYSLGGIVGSSVSDTLYACRNTGTISGDGTKNTSQIGGIAGYTKASLIYLCENTATVQAKVGYLGGLLGQANQTSLSYAVNIGNLASENYNNCYKGGLVGKTENASSILYSLQYSPLDSGSKTGAFIGEDDGTYATAAPNSNYYDQQMNPFAPIHTGFIAPSLIDGILTSNFIGSALRKGESGEGFTDQYWDFSPRRYPVLKIFASESEDSLYRLALILHKEDSINNIQHPFSFSSWPESLLKSTYGHLFIEKDTGYAVGGGEERLIFSMGSNSRNLQINVTVNTPFLPVGSGIESDPYLIRNLFELNLFRAQISPTENRTGGKHYRLTNDIAATYTFPPIGSCSGTSISQPNAFAGYFHGGGHTLSLEILNTGKEGVGLFGGLSNATVDSLTITGRVLGGQKVGGIAGGAYGSSRILYCQNKASVIIEANYGGGLVGYANGGAANTLFGALGCINDEVISPSSTSSSRMGGIVGHLSYGRIDSSINQAALNFPATQSGGIAGYIEYSTLEDCQNTHTISGRGYVGGIVGESNTGTVAHCKNTNTVNGTERVGGMVGYANKTRIKNCINFAPIKGVQGYTGGIAGYLISDTIEECKNIGPITGPTSATYKYVGGIAGYASSAQIRLCENMGEISGNCNYVGGIAGGISSSSILYTINAGGLLGSTTYLKGGITGQMLTKSQILNSLQLGSLPSSSKIGALVGEFDNSSTSTSISNYYDGQMCNRPSLAVGDSTKVGVQKMFTLNLVGNSLNSGVSGEGFTEKHWTFTPNNYPSLKIFATDSIDILYRQALLLNTTEDGDRILQDFYTHPEKGIAWSSSSDHLFVYKNRILPIKNGSGSLACTFGSFQRKLNLSILPINFTGGTGTEEDPYLISRLNDLLILRDRLLSVPDFSTGKHFRLTNSISDTLSLPIGPTTEDEAGFNGYFHGGGYRLTLGILTNSRHSGLFTLIQNSAVIDSLSTLGFVYSTSSIATGAIVGSVLGGRVSFCQNLAEIRASYRCGGIAGSLHSNGILDHCSNTGNITATGVVAGGILGNAGALGADGGDIYFCCNTGNIQSRYGAGGIIGVVSDQYTTLRYCVNSGMVYATDSMAGGIIGGNLSMNCSHSINTGVIKSPLYIGGILGNKTVESSFVGGFSNCLYDFQMTPYKANGNEYSAKETSSRQTSQIVGSNIKTGDTGIGFTGEHWIFRDGFYPILKDLPSDSTAILASIPIYLSENNSLHHLNTVIDVKHHFLLNNSYGVQWKSLKRRCLLNKDTALIQSLGNDSLQACLGSFQKTIPLQINHIPCKVQQNMNLKGCDSVIFYSNREKKDILFKKDTVYYDSLITSQLCDSILVVNIRVFEPISDTLRLDSCNHVTYKGHVYSRDTTFEDSLKTIHGCDSTVNVYILIRQASYSHLLLDSCGQVFYKGHIYTKDTLLYDTLTNYQFCDSIIKVDIRIETYFTRSVFLDSCQKVTYKEQIYFSDTTLSELHPNPQGCDTLFQINIHIKKTPIKYLFMEECKWVEYKGVIYQKDTSFSETIPSKPGLCDTLQHIRITIKKDIPITIILDSCGKVTYKGHTFTKDTSFGERIESPTSCDTLLTTYIVVYSEGEGNLTLDSCNHVTYQGHTYTQDTNFTHTLTTADGCDSIFHIKIRVRSCPVLYIDSSYIVLLWDHTVGCANYKNLEAFKTARYKWYLNGRLLPSQKAFLPFPGCVPEGLYRVELHLAQTNEVLSTTRYIESPCLDPESIITPNPVHKAQTFRWKIAPLPASNSYTLTVLNSRGQTVQIPFHKDNFGFEFNGFDQAGLYLIIYKDGNGTLLSKKVIVNK